MEEEFIDPHPTPGTTVGYFLAHYDLGPAFPPEDCIVYQRPYGGAMECARDLGIVFRSYSCAKTTGRKQDFTDANIRSFPMLVLSHNGTEIGRYICGPASGTEEIKAWVRGLIVKGLPVLEI